MKKSTHYNRYTLHVTRYNCNPLTLLFLSAFCLLPSTLLADKISYEIKQEFSVSKIETELQNIINNATYSDTVIVTGSKTDADKTLTLNIAADKMVVWQATYQSTPSIKIDALLSFLGSGTFEVANGTLITENAHAINATGLGSTVIVSGNGKVQTSGSVTQISGTEVHTINTSGNVEIKDNAQVSGTAGEVIGSNSDNSMVTVSGGSITTKSGNAIVTRGKDSKIFVSGGYVSNDADDHYPTIYAKDQRPGSNAFVHVSGTAVVEAKGYSYAVVTEGSVKVSGDAQITNSKGFNVYTATIRASNFVEVGDNAKISASKNNAIFCLGSVYISGNAKVEAKEDAVAIFISGGSDMEYVTVRDKAQVIAANNYAISHNISKLSVRVFGGVVFAYGNERSHVINSTYFLSLIDSSGLVLAWDKDAGNTNYERFSTDDIFVSKETATAYWDVKGGKHGISYANGNNTGFIPLEVNVLSVKEQDLPGIEVYPNPTTGELRIEVAGQARNDVQGVEVFDVYGRKVLDDHNSYGLTVLRSYGLSNLPAGVYFVRIEIEKGTITKKIIKQ